jgi:Flp pilus assembly protein TadD
LRSLVAVMFIAWLLRHWKRPSSKILPVPTVWALLILLLVELISTLFSLAPGLSLWGSLHRGGGLLTTVVFVGLFIVASQGLQDVAARDRLVTALLAVSLPVALYAIIQHGEIDPLIWAGNVSTRATSTIGNPIFLAAFLNFAFLFGLARLMHWLSLPGDNPALRSAPLLLALLFIQLWGIWLAQSRGPVLALAVGLLALALVLGRPRRVSVKRILIRMSQTLLALLMAVAVAWTLLLAVNMNWTAAIVPLLLSGLTAGLLIRYDLTILLPGIALLAALVLIFSFAFQLRVEAIPADYSVEEHALDIIEPLQHTLKRSSSARERILYWQGYRDTFFGADPIKLWQLGDDVTLTEDKWSWLRIWLGYGPEMGGDVLSAHYPAELGARYPPSTKIDRAHNSVWDKLVNQGVFGLVAWLAFLIILIHTAIRRLGRQITPRLRWSCWASAMLMASTATWILGSEFFGLCLQLGLVAGALLQLLFSRPQHEQTTDWLGGAALAAILMHLSETSVGISVTSNGLMFWLCAALVLCIPAKSSPSVNLSTDSTGALLAVMVGGLIFSFLGIEGTPRFDTEGVLMVGTPFNPGLIGWLANISGSAWQTGSAAGLVALYAGIFGLGTIAMGLLLRGPISAKVGDLQQVLRKFWPIVMLAGLSIWLWQWQLSTQPVPLTWDDSDALITAGKTQADRFALRVPLFYLWVIVSLFWLFHSLPSPKQPALRQLSPVTKPLVVLCTIAVIYMVGIRPSLANAYAHYAKRWASGDLGQWLALTGKTREIPYQIAREVMQQAVTLAPGRPEYRIALADMYSMSGQTDVDSCHVKTPTNQALFQAIKLHPADVIAVRGLAVLADRQALAAQDHDKHEHWSHCALTYYQQLRLVSPTHPQILAETGLLALRTLKRPALADTLASEALTLDGNTQTAVQIKIGLALKSQKQSCSTKKVSCAQDRQNLLIWLERALQINSKDLKTRLLLIDQYLLLGNGSQAGSVLVEGMIKHPRDAALRAKLVRMALSTNRPGLPIAVIDQALNKKPGNIALLLARIELLLIAERRDEAIDALQALVDSKRLQNKSATHAARIYDRLGELVAARDTYRLALLSAPGNASILLEAARFTALKGDRSTELRLLNSAALHAGNRLQAVQIEQSRLANYRAQSAEHEIDLTKRRLRALLATH